jgi:hypothetical protein
MTVNTSKLNASQLAFAIAALDGNADTSSLRKALIALTGQQEAIDAIKAALEIIEQNQF